MRAIPVLLTLVAVAMPAAADNPKTLVNGNNTFAIDLYRQLAKGQEGNLFYSPYSISTALAMTYAGARGDTATEMEKVLHFTEGQEKLHPAFAELIGKINGDEKQRPFQLYTANMLWGQKGYDFRADFIDLTQKHYGAGLAEVDFIKATEDARKAINDWVEKQTKDRIKDLIPPGVLDDMTRLVLTNAIYFMGNWEHPFDPKQTREGDFTLADGKKVKVSMMHQSGGFALFAGDGLQGLELPYKGKRLSMLILLPSGDLSAAEKNLTPENLDRWLGKKRPGRVDLTMPKFKMTSEFQLKPTLSALGMPTAFSPGKADLSGISGRKDLYISNVIHKAFVDVNELGTEAAAATGVVVGTTSLPPQFVVNRPFLFLLRDNDTGSILFIGRVMNPKG